MSRMNANTTNVQISLEITLEPHDAFDVFVDELRLALFPEIIFEPGEGGRMTAGDTVVGTVTSWQPGKQIMLRWQPASWEPDEITQVQILFEAVPGGTKVTVNHAGWGKLLDNMSEITGWFANQVAAPLLKATSPDGFGDWITDRRARRPSGAGSRSVYRDPLYHYPNFQVLLEELALTPPDYLVEIGCGGGAFLKEALKSGCRAAAIDHSLDMVQLATSENQAAIQDGRLDIRQASSDNLPFPNDTFTCAVMTGVLGFLPDPVASFREIRRVLKQNGRFVCLGSDPELRGTPAAPEPMASRLNFYSEEELGQIAEKAGFDPVNVIRRNLGPYAKKVGIPEEFIGLFSGPGSQFLIAHKGNG